MRDVMDAKMTTVTKIEKEIGGATLSLETGKVARQAHGAVTVRYADTVVLATALSAPPTRDIDYFPLFVEYREMQYAGGKFPGGFFKREGRPSTKETLGARMIDRTIRPLFPEDFQDEVQIQCLVVSADKDQDADVLALIGSSAALAISQVPFLGPVAAVRLCHSADGQHVLFPSYEQREASDMDLVISGHRDAVNMIELEGKEVGEDAVVRGCEFGFKYIGQIIEMIDELVRKAGTEKAYTPVGLSPELVAMVEARCRDRIRQAKRIEGKAGRGEAVGAVRDELLAELCPEGAAAPQHAPADVRKAFGKVEARVMRESILAGSRPDGRGLKEIRPIIIDVPFLPRTHGSALFTRGETQSLATVTLGTPRDQQKVDGLREEYFKRFLLHYNFPPFSVAEIRPVRGPSRRDIGHGALAEKSLEAMMPTAEEFPYTIRVVSEILESNGSSSMATVCSATLALMDAGVPIKAPVAGISIGMVRENGRKALLTDIIGEEDFQGDMDFKVAGTRKGITGIQFDIKPAAGLDIPTIAETLVQAKEARLVLLDEIERAIPAPRADISPYAPRMFILKIDPEKIGAVIGPGGKTINGLQAKYEVTIDVEDDGTIYISGLDSEKALAARAEIESMTQGVEIGRIYDAKVVGLKDFGAFLEIFPGQDGLCHVSELSDEFVKKVSDVCKIGDILRVKVIAVDDQGRVKLSRKAVMREEKKTSR